MVAVDLEILSCLGYVLAFLQVFDRAPVRFGARVALSELAFGAAVSLGGAGSVAVGAWLLVERGGEPTRIAERSAVLFLLTSAINVITLAVAGLALFFGILPGAPRSVAESCARARRDGRVRVLPAAAAASASGSRHRARRGSCARCWSRSRRRSASPSRSCSRATGGSSARSRSLWCDIAVLAACFAAAGTVPPVAVIVLAYQIGYLSNVIPIPGNIGVLDGSLVGMFVLYGVSATLATAATVVYHAIALWVPAMWGTVAFLILRRTRDRPIDLRPPRDVRRRLRREARERRAGRP